MKKSLVVASLMLMNYVHILEDPTFEKIIEMLLGERGIHDLNPIGNIIINYVVVDMDI